MSEDDLRQRLVEWFDEVVRDVHGRLAEVEDGVLASYIPELANVNPDGFAIATMTVNGQSTEMGDCEQHFTISRSPSCCSTGWRSKLMVATRCSDERVWLRQATRATRSNSTKGCIELRTRW